MLIKNIVKNDLELFISSLFYFMLKYIYTYGGKNDKKNK